MIVIYPGSGLANQASPQSNLLLYDYTGDR